MHPRAALHRPLPLRPVQDAVGELGRRGGTGGVKVFFGGDTGYRAVLDGQDEDNVPVCPAFKEIGEKFGGFDFAMISIGAYMPRQLMSSIHCAPQDSTRPFKDIRAKRALGMHWGTWVLTTEDVLDPPKRLAEECKKVGIEDGAFRVCEIGETCFF
ncbi:putative beta-lactamase superfamily domain containing protein [Lyophyllum shimeji]|uniref:Beta-lactamase superfamily domain containing protein n=1 Tax=Lyophyllum shimeji TaxID=47721 RepID=A0A9P3PWT9_LYOSH|nr:putative beta-lactamase superfamily domain containing protein [Lyophyllum shimeji]